jgi:Aspartyl protease
VTIFMAVTAAFALAAPLPHANAASDVRVIPPPVHEHMFRALRAGGERSFAAAAAGGAPSVIRAAGDGARAARYVRLKLDVTAYGIAGRGEILVDRATGRYVRRFDAGPVSEREGWDGTRAWRADATGMPRVEGNADERAAIVTWSELVAPDAGAMAHEHPSRAPEIAADAAGEITSVVRHVGHSTERTTFAEYRAASGFDVPSAIADTSDNGVWSARTNGVETPRTVAAGAFAPPPEPRDATLRGVTTVTMLGRADLPLIPVSVNGVPLRLLLDTGGQNVITPEAARRAGLDVVGDGTVGGAGAGLVKVRFASARSVRVGAAEMRDQPFLVLDLGLAGAVDGIVGYELLARFSARLDTAHERLELAPDVHALAPGGVAVPMVFADRQPQVDGAIDGIPGAMTLDTGSASSLDVNTPFVLAHDLRAKYHAEAGGYPISGVGGPVHAYFAHANELRLGDLAVPDVNMLLTDAHAGVEADPTIAANVGEQVLRRFAIVLDYRHTTLHFEPLPR